MGIKRPPIPSGIKRLVRQKCKFGCVICGSPIYDYEHLEEYSIVQEHSVDNIYLLCPNHHRLKSNGAITKDFIRQKLNSLNRDSTTPQKIFQTTYSLILGNNIIQQFRAPSGYFFDIMGKDFFKLKVSDELLIDACIHDRNGNPAIRILNNEYKIYDKMWDVEWDPIGVRLIFRNNPRNIVIDIKFQPKDNSIQLLGKLYFDSFRFLDVKNEGIFYNGVMLASGNRIINAQCGVAVLPNAQLSRLPVTFRNFPNCYGNFMVGQFIGFGYSYEFFNQE